VNITDVLLQVVRAGQWQDLVGVIKVQGPAIDREYLHRWAAQLKVNDLLERALAEAGLGS